MGNWTDHTADVLDSLRVRCERVGNDVYLGLSGVSPAPHAIYEEGDESDENNGADYGSDYNANITPRGRGVSIEVTIIQSELQPRGSKCKIHTLSLSGSPYTR